MVARWGGYHLIPDEVWAEFDRLKAQWEDDRRDHTLGGRHWRTRAWQECAAKRHRQIIQAREAKAKADAEEGKAKTRYWAEKIF